MLNVAVVVVSSKIANGMESDTIYPALAPILHDHEMKLMSYDIVPDERERIREHLLTRCNMSEVQVVLTIGGTGVRPSDWTPEATREICEKEIPGIGEAMRAESMKKVRTAMLSRATAGIRGRTLIVNLPGSIKGIKDNIRVVLPILEHTVEKIAGQSGSSKPDAASRLPSLSDVRMECDRL